MKNIDAAFQFYKKHILDKEKFALLHNYGLPQVGSVPSVLWELFGAILTGKKGKGATGADLIGWEVKSAKTGCSFEYQYHLNTGIGKLHEDCTVNHLFCSYSSTYEDVHVRVAKGVDLAADYFDRWKPGYQLNYNSSVPSNERRQRFRRSISPVRVNACGGLILIIAEGELIERHDDILDSYNCYG